MKNIIYALVDPETKEIRYIGKSTSGLMRPREHLKPSKYNSEQNHKANWIKLLISKGLEPDIIVLYETATPEELENLEIETIKSYRAAGYNLTNLTDGGEGSLGRIVKDSTKKLMSERRKQYYENLTERPEAANKNKHIEIDGTECKECYICKGTLPVATFVKNKNRWDGFENHCKKCYAAKVAVLRKPYEKMSEEDLAQSYKDRARNISEALKAKLESDPTIKQKYSLAKKKAVVGVSTTSTIRFASAKDAKEHGFDNTNIGKAIRMGTLYRGYKWSFE